MSSLDIDLWQNEVKQRVGFFLKPREIRSLLVIQPAASGDVALTSTLISQVKENNPQCHVTLLTRGSTAHVAGFCPWVDSVEVIAPELLLLGRRELLQRFATGADAVVHTWYFSEDQDLGARYNLLETIWLLAGWPHPPIRPVTVNLQVPGERRDIDGILDSVIGIRAMLRWTQTPLAEIAFCLKQMLAGKIARETGLRASVHKFLHSIRSISQILRSTFIVPKRGYVIISLSAFSVAKPPPEFGFILVQKLKMAGWIVLHNVLDPFESLAGTIPLVCTYADFLWLRKNGIPLVAWRSGLCDIAVSAKNVPIVALYPRNTSPHPRPIIELFGFKSMGIRANCLDLICDSIELLDWKILLRHLETNSAKQ